MKVLKHRDYIGSVTYDSGELFISVLHIDDSVSAACDSASRAQEIFESLIEDYIATCAEIGKEPCKPFKGSFNVRIPPELHKQAVFAASEAGQSLNTWVSGAIEGKLEHSSETRAERQRALIRLRNHQHSTRIQSSWDNTLALSVAREWLEDRVKSGRYHA